MSIMLNLMYGQRLFINTQLPILYYAEKDDDVESECCRIVVSRSHQGDVMKMAEKFKPPGVVTPAGGAGYKVGIHQQTEST